MNALGRLDARTAGGLVGGAVLAAALLLSSPGLAPLDAGDFVTAAVDVGVPHATGFPAHTLIGIGATRLPWGNVAARAAWPSAFAMAWAAAALTWLLAQVVRRASAALAGGLLIVAACVGVDTLRMHAAVPEVYALNVALVLTALCLIVRLDVERDQRLAALAGLAIGLGLANHALFRLWTPALLVAIAVGAGAGRRVRAVSLALLGLAATLATYAYLPAAALRHPRHNWGDPSTLSAFWRHVNAVEVREAFGGQMFSGVAQQSLACGTLIDQLVAGLGIALLLGLVGLATSALRAPRPVALLVALAVADAAYAVLVNPMGLRDAQNGQLVALTLAFGAAAVIAELYARSAGRWGVRWLVVSVSLALSLTIVAGVRAGDRIAPGPIDHTAEDLALIHLGTAAPGSITTLTSDLMVAGSLYAHVALDARPDAAVFGRGLLSTDRAFQQLVGAQPFALVAEDDPPGPPDQTMGRNVVRMLEHNLGRRVIYWEIVGTLRDLPGGVDAIEGWPLSTVVAGQAPDGCVSGPRAICGARTDAAFAGAARASSGSDGNAYRRWLAAWWGARGISRYGRGAWGGAAEAFVTSLALTPESAAYRASLAASLASLGRIEEAWELAEEGVALDPSNRACVRNALRYAQALGRSDDVARLGAIAERYGIDVSDLR